MLHEDVGSFGHMPSPAPIAEAAGLFLRGGYTDAFRAIDPMLRPLLRSPMPPPLHQSQPTSTAASPCFTPPMPAAATQHLKAAAAAATALSRENSPPHDSLQTVLDDDAVAVLLIAGYAQLFLFADSRWVRSIATTLTDRYPLFTIGFVLRAEADAACADFASAYNLLSRVERDLVTDDLPQRLLYSALASTDVAAAASAAAPDTVHAPIAACLVGPPAAPMPLKSPEAPSDDMHFDVDNIESPRSDEAPVGFTATTSKVFIRAVWLHITARRLGAEQGAEAPELYSLSSERLKTNTTSDIELVKRYVSTLRCQLQRQEAAWLRYQAVVQHAQCVGAKVFPCGKCAALPVAGALALPPQWRCTACYSSDAATLQRRNSSADMKFVSSRSSSNLSSSANNHTSPNTTKPPAVVVDNNHGSPPPTPPASPSNAYARPPPQHTNTRSSFTATATMPERRPSMTPLRASTVDSGRNGAGGNKQAVSTPRSPAGSFAYFRALYDGSHLTLTAQRANSGRLSRTSSHHALPTHENASSGPPLSVVSSTSSAAFSAYLAPSDVEIPSSAGYVWAPDGTSSCHRCARGIGRLTRHHCRSCGRLVCSTCSKNTRPVPLLGFEDKVRVCDNCVLILDSNAAAPLSSSFEY
jgi:hypothetical protein